MLCSFRFAHYSLTAINIHNQKHLSPVLMWGKTQLCCTGSQYPLALSPPSPLLKHLQLTNNLRYVGAGHVQVNRYLCFLISSHLPDHNHTVKLSWKCGFRSEGAPACCGGKEERRHFKRSVTDQVLHFNFNYPHTVEAEHLSGLASPRCASPWQCHHPGEPSPSDRKSVARFCRSSHAGHPLSWPARHRASPREPPVLRILSQPAPALNLAC